MPLLNIRLFKFSKKPVRSEALATWNRRHKRLIGFLALLFLCLGLISPYQYIIKEQAIVTPEEILTLSNRVPGTITHIYVKTGQTVAPGEILLQLKNPELEAQASIAMLEYEQMKLRLLQLKANSAWESADQAIAAQEALKSAQKMFALSSRHLEELTLTSTTTGTILTSNVDRLTGVFVPEATPLIKIGDTQNLKLLIPIPEKYIRHITNGNIITGTWVATGDPLRARITEIPNQKASFPNDYFEAIYSRFGGPAPKQQFQSIEDAKASHYPIYIVEAHIASPTRYYHQAMRAQIKISGKRTLLILHLKDSLTQLFN